MTDQPDPDRQDEDTTPAQEPAPDPPKYGDEVDDAAADSFPASDPPSFTGSSSTRDPEN